MFFCSNLKYKTACKKNRVMPTPIEFLIVWPIAEISGVDDKKWYVKSTVGIDKNDKYINIRLVRDIVLATVSDFFWESDIK